MRPLFRAGGEVDTLERRVLRGITVDAIEMAVKEHRRVQLRAQDLSISRLRAAQRCRDPKGPLFFRPLEMKTRSASTIGRGRSRHTADHDVSTLLSSFDVTARYFFLTQAAPATRPALDR